MRGKGRVGGPCKGLGAERSNAGPGRDAWAGGESRFGPSRTGLVATVGVIAARALEAETERWFLWLPVFFAAGILAYFALSTEPDPHLATALVLGTLGLLLTVRHVEGCTLRHVEGCTVRHVEGCRTADIGIAPFTIGKGCRAARVIVDRRVLK
jgi:hypothetical protein